MKKPNIAYGTSRKPPTGVWSYGQIKKLLKPCDLVITIKDCESKRQAEGMGIVLKEFVKEEWGIKRNKFLYEVREIRRKV